MTISSTIDKPAVSTPWPQYHVDPRSGDNRDCSCRTAACGLVEEASLCDEHSGHTLVFAHHELACPAAPARGMPVPDIEADEAVVLLLDVDGVVNATHPLWEAETATGRVPVQDQTFTLTWAPALVDVIRQYANSGCVDVRWCTTWCEEATQLEYLWQLPHLARAWQHNPDDITAAKAQAAWDVIDSGRRLIWADDSVTPTHGGMFDELTAGHRALLLRPQFTVGLTPADVDAMDAFITRHLP